jgi:hypothetical protein
LSTKLTAIENLSGAGFITQNGSGAIAGRTLQAGTGISIAHGNGSSQDPIITNSAPDQTVALTGGGATSISGTYPNFTISSVNTTYGAATSTVPGLIELGSDTAQTVAANAVTATASRSYALQVNAAGQGVVNVPWTNSGGTVTSVGGTGTVSGLSLSGTVTTSGNLTLGGTLAVTPSNFASQTAKTVLAAPNAAAGVPTFRLLVASDIPTLNQNTTGTAANVTGTVAIANGGTGATTAAIALTNLGAYAATNPNGYITTPFPVGTVMLFAQTAAPTGWTKVTTHDNKALRVVSGTASSGGSVAFTTAFASQAVSGSNSSTTVTGTVNGTTLSGGQLASHSHGRGTTYTGGPANPGVQWGANVYYTNSGGGYTADGAGTDAAGGNGSHDHGFSGGSHTHTFTGTAINLAVQYVDVILASKA